MAFKLKQASSIGLDIGSYSIKCVEMTEGKERPKLRHVALLPLESPSQEHLVQALKAALDPMGVSPNKRVHISLSGAPLFIRRIQMPVMTEEELQGAIRFEAEKHIPFSAEECVVDVKKLDENQDKNSMNVLLVAAKRDFILERLKLLSDLDIHPQLIDADAFCLMNAYEILNGNEPAAVHGLLNIGHGLSSFAILRDGLPFFVRDIAFGAAEVTKAFAEIKGIPEAEAVALKMNCTLENVRDLRAATQKGFKSLVEELTNSITYFESDAGQELKDIWVSGGGSLSVDAPTVLSEMLGRTVSFWDNTKKMEILSNAQPKFLEKHAAELNIALGMALRGLRVRP